MTTSTAAAPAWFRAVAVAAGVATLVANCSAGYSGDGAGGSALELCDGLPSQQCAAESDDASLIQVRRVVLPRSFHRRAEAWWSGALRSWGRSTEPVDEHPWTNRHLRWRMHEHLKWSSPRDFFLSALRSEWTIFLIMLTCYIMLYMFLVDSPGLRRYHGMAVVLWMCAAAVYNAVIWVRMGPSAGEAWLMGYFMEFIFSLENVFIYHFVVEAFKTPKRLAEKALLTVVCCQVVFQMVFFMGLAEWLTSIECLPYLLGLWLIYVGIETARGDDHVELDVEESTVFKLFRWCLGNRLSTKYRDDGKVFFVSNGKTHVTMLCPVIVCLLLVDFVMEVDVTLTKIEEISNPYIAFTSSVAAAFAMPEIFNIAQIMFRDFHLLRYGITFVLVFFGSQLLLHQVVNIPDMAGLMIVAGVLVLCIIVSPCIRRAEQHAPEGKADAVPSM